MIFSRLFRYCPVCGSEHFEANNEKSMRCSSCKFELYINASAAVAAFIRNENNELLVCRRKINPAKGTLDLPGGFVDAGETIETALTREILEETSCETVRTNYLFSLPNTYEYCGFSVPTIDLFYECSIKDINTLKANDDVEECFFVKPDQLDPAQFGLQSISQAVALFLEKNSDI